MHENKGEMTGNQVTQEGGGEDKHTPGTTYNERAEERGQLVLRQQKLSVAGVNVSFEGKDNHKRPKDDHYEVFKQVGLIMVEMRGTFVKLGFLEVGMIPVATHISRALRVNSKEVNKKIMITSIREHGTTMPDLIGWC